jgi:hypothetical protein
MYRKKKGIQVFLTISILIFFSVLSAYFYYNNFLEMDFPFAKLTFKNLDQDPSLANHKNKSFAFEQNISLYSLETYPFHQFTSFSFRISSLNKKLLSYVVENIFLATLLRISLI